MIKHLLLASFTLAATGASAQTVSGFENQPLTGNDTAYINYSMPGKDVGFTDGLAYFPCVYDTSGGYAYWSGGFAYSNHRDTAATGYAAQYNAKPGKGAGFSQKYAVYFEPYSHSTFPHLRLTGAARGRAVRGFYLTNTNYAYSSMKNGDFFSGPRFGDTSATDQSHNRPDFFKLTVRGYSNGVLKSDSVEFYLADYRSSNNANDYIVSDWKYLSLLPLGKVDSLDFFLSSSRNNQFGNLIPAYFAMDNFVTDETNTSVGNVAAADIRVFPNPATDRVFVSDRSKSLRMVTVLDMSGAVVARQSADAGAAEVNIAGLPSGIYQLVLDGTEGAASVRISKQ